MGTLTKLTFEQFQKLPEQEGKRFELDEGELLMEPSPTFLHNRVRDRIARKLSDFVEAHKLGEITVETDFRLGPDTVRNPDIAMVTPEHLRQIDLLRSPVEGPPVLAIEVISPGNSAEEIAKKIQQYLSAGCRSVWIVFPTMRLVEIHSGTGVRKVQAPEPLRDDALLPGFSLPLSEIF